IQVLTVEQAERIRSHVSKILYLGDMLISYGDFLENNSQLPSASFVEEIWAQQLRSKLPTMYEADLNRERLIQLAENPHILPSVDEAFEISNRIGLALHPKYSFYWDSITLEETLYLKEKITKDNPLFLDTKLKDILERLGIVHSIMHNHIILDESSQATSLRRLLSGPDVESKNAIEFVKKSSGVLVMPKFSSTIAVRVGRPEKAAERKLKPPVHVLFPIGPNGGSTRDILKACKEDSFYTQIANRYCDSCRLPSLGTHCRSCGVSTMLRNLCIVCREEVEEGEKCIRCGKEGRTYSSVNFPLKFALEQAKKKLGVNPQEPFKGVKLLMSTHKSAEPLEKGILRQKHGLHTFKDGTIRFDATNEPLTHFKPTWISASLEKLRGLGYTHDYLGRDLTSPDQIVELMMQDIIIPGASAKYLVNAAKFIDEELVKLYDLEPFYGISSLEDLISHLIIGLAPHTSVGIVGRIIGFVDSQVCLASPIWHSAKRRDCDGDADSVMLLMDALLNFSYDFLPNKIGGLMDAPLLIQPVVLPHEVQRQAHNVDISNTYPLAFYEATWNQAKAADVADMVETIKNRIGDSSQFFGYGFTHMSDALVTKAERSAYSTLNTMEEKLKMQFDAAKLINAVDADEVAAMVLTTHILPDIIGNMRSYSSQTFRCTRCGAKFRRMPLMGKCINCGNALIQTVTRGAVEKYLSIATSMSKEYKISDYLRSRIESIALELKLIFKEEKQAQSSLMEFMSG
ncbi:MAG TPA: DNA polymerase II large subunit, partial [Nitrososphaera sp.]